MVLTVIIFESALELMPESLRSHPTIRKEWKVNTRKKKRGIILDKAIHNPLMESLNDHKKRGRPDIVHSTLLNLIYSPLVKNGTLKIIIHTYNNRCIHIPTDWRIPVNYNRFTGLMAQLLYNKQIPVEGDPILTVNKCSLRKLLQEHLNHQIFLLESVPESSSIVNNLNGIFSEDSIFLIGGFQSGSPDFDFETDILNSSNFRILSLYKDVIPAWVVASKLLYMIEEQMI
jgi:rRNA small subunit pseudouridine methyltransferase Nep1